MSEHNGGTEPRVDYRILFTISPDAMFFTSADGRLIEANRAFLDIAGTDSDTIGEIDLNSLFPDTVKYNELLGRLRQRGEVKGFELACIASDGSLIFLEIHATALVEGGRTAGFVFVAHDVSSRMLKERIWRTMSSIVESTDDAIIGKTLDGYVVSWNNAAEKLYGYSSGEMIGNSLDRIIPDDRPDEIAQILERIRKGGRVEHFETERITKDGRRIDVSLTVSPIIDETDHIIGASAIARDISESKRLLATLRESEERYRGLVESQIELIVRVTPEGVFTFVNDAYCVMFGKTREELVGNTFMPLVHEDDIEATMEAMKGLYRPPYRIYVEQRAMTVDGWRWIAWEDYAIRDESDELLEIQGVGRDITEKKTAEIALKESQRKYQSVFDKANDYIVLLDTNGTVLEINERIESGMGYRRGDLVGRNIRELPFLSEKQMAIAIERFGAPLQGREVSTYELEFTKADGETLIGEVNAALVRLTETEMVDLVVVRDITGRKEAEKDRLELIRKLSEKTDELNIILESIGDAIITTDVDLKVTMVNHAFCELTGMPIERVIGRPCSDILHCIDHRGAPRCDNDCALLPTVENGEMTSGKTVVTDSDGVPITIEAINAPLKNADGEIIGTVKSIRDVSREAEIERMKNEFVSTVSHELRTPLTSIKGYVDVILAGETGEINELQREFLEIIHESSTRLGDLINDLLDIERIESGDIRLKVTGFDLGETVESVIRTMEAEAEAKNLHVITEIRENVTIEADRDKVIQIITNLLSNAIKFTREGSVAVAMYPRNGFAEIVVKDTGIGIAPADMKKLFGKFFRVENTYTRSVRGTGLGLSIVKSLVEMHGGEVTVKSRPNNGSAFTVRLPLEEKERPENHRDKKSPRYG